MVPQAKPGQIYAVQENGAGSFTLTLIEPKEPPSLECHLAKEDGFTVVVPEQPINEHAIGEILADFP